MKRNKQAKILEDLDNPLIEVFVQKNYDYYKEVWNTCKEKNSLNSLNWSALFLGPIWLAYRKMYLYLFLIYGGYIVLSLILNEFLGIRVGTVHISLTIYSAIGTNSLYLHFVKNKIKEIEESTNDENEKTTIIREAGGVSLSNALFVSALYIIILASYITITFVE